MNELQRTQYLEQMGIEVFVPRFVLPAAKLSLQATLPAAEGGSSEHSGKALGVSDAASRSIPQESTLESSAAKSSKNVSGIVTNIMGALGAELKSATKQDKPEPNQPSTQDQSNPTANIDQDAKLATENNQTQVAVAFSLSLWRVTDNLMVIDTRHPKQALPTTALLSNILFAKGVSQRLPAPEVLTWPMFDHMQTSGGWSEAADMVSAFLGARFSAQPVQYLWLMGESAFRAVASDSASSYEDRLGAALDLPGFSALGFVLPSLTDMLQQPELKRVTWNAIKAYGIE